MSPETLEIPSRPDFVAGFRIQRFVESLAVRIPEDQVIDDLYDLFGRRQTVWTATESF
jgi:hypothetical protein